MLRFGVSPPLARAYGPAREEDECRMVMDAGLDNTGQNDWNTTDQDTSTPGTGSSPRPDPDMPDPRKLAQDWITLWQSELSAMAADPEMRESWQTMMALWAGAVSAMIREMPRAQAAGGRDGPGGQAGTTDAPRAPPPAAALDARDAEIERLARHVALLEHRLAELERGRDPGVDSTRSPGSTSSPGSKRSPGRKKPQ